MWGATPTAVKPCQPCWDDGFYAEAHFFPSGVPMCDKHYSQICQKCQRNRGARLYSGEFSFVCKDCFSEFERAEARRREYNEHLKSKPWRETKKLLRRASAKENGRPVCARCNRSETENRHLYGEGLHGHHLTYERFGAEKIRDIELLCSVCHAFEHGQPLPKELKRFSKVFWSP